MTFDAFSLIECGNLTMGTSSCTSIDERAEAPKSGPGKRLADLLLILGLVFTVGTGGFAMPAAAQSTATPSSSRIWVATRHAAAQAPASDYQAHTAPAIAAPERITEIRQQLSLNVKQLAEAMLVERPTVYGWMKGTTPREIQQLRLKELYDIALEWKALSGMPVSKYLIAPLDGGASLMGLLRSPTLDRQRIEAAVNTISSTIRIAEAKKQNSDYKSVASVMAARKIKSATPQTQQQRIDEAVDLS